MAPRLHETTVFADEVGIHLRGVDGFVVVVGWDEISQVDALRETSNDGTVFIDLMIVHLSGVDFHVYSVDAGYEQTLLQMEKHLPGFRRASLQAVPTFDDAGQTIPTDWTR